MADASSSRLAAILPVTSVSEETLPGENGLQAEGCWPQLDDSSPDCLDDIPVGGSSRCYRPIWSKNGDVQSVEQPEEVSSDGVICSRLAPLSSGPPEIDETANSQCSSEQSNRTMETCGESEGGAGSPKEKVPTVHRALSPGKSKHRQRLGRSPDSRSGSPYSSDSLSSSSLSDRSASTTPKDTYSNETNENSSSSFEVGSDKEKTSSWSMANFDRVLHDAPKREHIRSRKSAGSRSSQGGKGGCESDSGSSSQSRNKPVKVLSVMRNKLHGRSAEIPVSDSGTSTSSFSASYTHFDQGKGDFQKNQANSSLVSNGTDTGIATANTSGHSVQYQSNFSLSSSSGVDTRQSVSSKERKTQPGKTVSSHYHDIRSLSKSDGSEGLSEGSSGAQHQHQHQHQHHHYHHHRQKEQNYTSDSASTIESERKRRRFNRTFVLLRHCGLLELTLQTASLMQQSSLMSQQLKSLRQQTEVLYNAIQGLSTTQPPASFDSATAQGILKNLRDIMIRHGGSSYTGQQVTCSSQHARRLAVKRTSSGETISPDSGNAQSSSALQNSGSST